mmetsp:Transcript_27310/g.57992  ORF Transcript_27310/g.57992 Transcript_27310/m.57992 type:complete len:921 (-) Transcript_27310:127-2889(-)|eukprot:CAMPEP_0206616930 /NCGR_PEP_ID=MMETSP0325_2-20121206/59293_1 /ASSEMBLY_ACC=CAM_ASM_000347 /TAXON_ID=2866 /ORGANISM="Crypthecodinium cohnii, Strain Seligo" /LENGTH=920 /DNA_ID=CAMNT_0054138737 /DNA_START=122 /DNA_END=2884 /DNA_ORIENTATION=+
MPGLTTGATLDSGTAAGAATSSAPAAAAAVAGAAGATGQGGSLGGGSGSNGGTGTSEALAVYDPEVALLLAEDAERREAINEMCLTAMGAVFSLRKPRDVVAGTSSGLKTMSKGLGLGVAALVSQPILGAKQSGAKGFVKGMGTGLLGFTASTVAGTAVGTTQIVRGVLNTPRAIVLKAKGRVWNAEQRKWEVDWYSLPEEAAEVLGDPESGGGGGGGGNEAGGGSGCGSGGGGSSSSTSAPRRPSRKVADRKLYDLLEVAPEATESEIRRAFYKKSLALHPDKNPDNPEAAAKFHAVSDAYRILGDDERRRQYDSHGEDSALNGLPKIEPAVFFAALFGSHHFEPWFGRLRLALDLDGDVQTLIQETLADGMANEEGPNIDPLKVHRAHKQMKKVERERQVRLAVQLASRLSPLVGIPDDQVAQATEQFEAEHKAEADKLAGTPCGPELLFAIGWIYANRARQFFTGTVLSRLVAQVEGSAHYSVTKAGLAGSIGRTCLTAMDQADKQKQKLSEEKDGEKTDGASTEQGGKEKDKKGSAAKGKDKDKDKGKTEPAGETAQTENASKNQQKSAPASGGSPSTSPPAAAPAAAKESPGDGSTTSGATTGGTATPAGQSGAPVPGTVVILANLQGAVELNNEIGIVVGYDDSAGRYLVQVMPDIGLKKFKRENLIVLEAGEGAGSSAGNSASASASAPSGGPESGGPGPGVGGAAPGGDDQDMFDAFQECLPLLHDSCWALTKLDIEFTLDKVVQKVLKDMSVSKMERRQRAAALLKLGEIFKEPLRQRKQQEKAKQKERKQKQLPAPEKEGLVSAQPSDESAASGRPVSPASSLNTATSTTATALRRSVLARFKPRAPWRSSTERKEQKAKEVREKIRRFEAAMTMMAAGASTDDVDEMVAARAAMDAEMEMGGSPTGSGI